MPREKGKAMANINLNDVRTPLTRKVNALYNVFASSNNLDDIENIADTLNCCADYGATVARKAAERQEAYSYLEGSDDKRWSVEHAVPHGRCSPYRRKR